MEKTRRDIKLYNVKIEENTLKSIDEYIKNQEAALNKHDQTYVIYTIRYDQKGFRVFNLTSLLVHFNQAELIEHITINLETDKSLNSKRLIGSFIEINLTNTSPENSILIVESIDKDWVDNAFLNLQEILLSKKSPLIKRLIRTKLTEPLLQITSLLVFFILSLKLAQTTSTELSIQKYFTITFIFWLLLFSNLWTYIKLFINHLMLKYLPNITFYRPNKDQWAWIREAFIGTALTSVTFYIFISVGKNLLITLLTFIGHHA